MYNVCMMQVNNAPDTAEIYQQFREPLKNYIGKRISDPTTTEDVLHDVFVRIHNQINTLKDEERLQSWIYTIARNAVIDFYRKKREHVDIPDDIASQPEMITDISERLAQTVHEMIKKLPDKYKEALMLADIENIKQGELADRLGISLPGAKSRVQRARKMLKDLLLACCHFEFDRYGTVFDYHPKNCSECCEGKEKNHTCKK